MRGRPVPSWLRAEWKRIPEAPQQETIEARALFLMQAYRDREVWLKKKPNLLQALAFDLMSAAYENPTRRRWPDEIGWLMSLALGLPAEHEAGNWVDQLQNENTYSQDTRADFEFGLVTCINLLSTTGGRRYPST